MLEDAIQLHRAGRLAEAEAGYRQHLAEEPDNPEVLHLLGILRGQLGDMGEALQLVRRAGEIAPDNATCQYTLGEMYVREGALEDASAAYDRARMLNPNLAAAHAGLGQVAFLRGDMESAEQHFRVALRADENDVRALTGLGNLAHIRGDAQRALKLLTQAAELAPDDPLIQISYAQAMLDQGMTDFAARAVDNVLATRPDDPLAQALRAELHVRKGEFDEALPIYQSLLARGEQVGAARTGLGDIARAHGRTEEAIGQYDEALRAQPNLQPAAIRRANALARSGRVGQAIDDLQGYVREHPHGMRPYMALASLLMQAGRHDEALAVWQAAAVRWPEDLEVKAQHAMALDRAGHFDEALALAETAAASPRPAVAMLRARGALVAGDPAAAVQRLQRVEPAQLADAPPQLARRHQRLLGLAFDALEQWPDAVQAFLAAQRQGVPLPDLPSLDQATRTKLQTLAAGQDLAEDRGAPPVLLCGLPGSGVELVAALLADQPGWFVRRDRFATSPDFIEAPFVQPLRQPLDQGDLSLLARRYRRPLARANLPEGTRVVDWLPVLDANVVPVLKRALPGVQLLVVRREPHDMLLNWLALAGRNAFSLTDPLEGARWLRLAATHLAVAADILPTFRADPDALLAARGDDARMQLGLFLDLEELVPGPAAQAVAAGRPGIPASFPGGHASHYREALADAFAVMDDEVFA